MGKNTIMRIRKKAQLSKVTSRTTNLICMGVLLVAAAITYVQLPDYVLNGSDAGKVPELGEVPDGVKLKKATEYELEPPSIVSVSAPYDIRDEKVLVALTGKIMELGKDPLAALDYSREFDGDMTSSVFEEEPDPSSGWVRRVGDEDDRDPSSSGVTDGGDDEFSPKDKAEFRRALKLVKDADGTISGWRGLGSTDEQNEVLKKGKGIYKTALAILRSLREKYPDSGRLKQEISETLRGYHTCLKHGTG